MKQVRVMCFLFMLISAFFLLVPHGTYAFDVNTTVTNEGNLSVDMSVKGASAPDGAISRLDRYRFELDGRDGTTALTNTYTPETGQTGASIGYVADPDYVLMSGKLSADEEIGVNHSNSDVCCAGAASSSFEVEELVSDSTGNFNNSSYTIEASGRTADLGGSFGVGVAENMTTPNPAVYERNIYQLKGEGVFSISGQYGFGCGDVGAVAPNPFAGVGSTINAHGQGTGGVDSDIGIHGLCFDQF
ncbi:MAG: hypothetical protein SWH78_14990 [Thermodesulfobacteriota bacterium]|nr:hypothetical protein [Thermodesulfobacteriota bacterium]